MNETVYKIKYSKVIFFFLPKRMSQHFNIHKKNSFIKEVNSVIGAPLDEMCISYSKDGEGM